MRWNGFHWRRAFTGNSGRDRRTLPVTVTWIPIQAPSIYLSTVHLGIGPPGYPPKTLQSYVKLLCQHDIAFVETWVEAADWESGSVGWCGKDGRQAGGRADTHNGAGASHRIVSQSLATMHRNSLQQCAAMPTTMRGIACREREAERGRGVRTGTSLTLLPLLPASHHT